MCSCKIDQGRQEIILPVVRDNECYPTSSDWQSHVLGPDSLMLNTSSSQTLTYQLSTNNDVLLTGRLRNLQAMSPFYLNLISTEMSPVSIPSLDGHFIHVRSSNPAIPLNVTGDIKFDLLNGTSLTTPFNDNGQPVLGLIQDNLITMSVTHSAQNPSSQEELGNSVVAPEDAILMILTTPGISNRTVEVSLSSNSPSTPVLKLRVRIKSDGISVMPVQMNDFKCSYRIRW